jgi:DNA repair protein RadC
MAALHGPKCDSGGPRKTTMADEDQPHYLDHRKRLRERFLRDGSESFADYELLELLLCLAIPRRDVKPLAKTLIRTFGSFAGVIAAEPSALAAVDGVGETTIAALKLARASALRITRTELIKRDIVSSWQALVDYCRARIAFAGVEEFHVLFLDGKNAVIAAERQQSGTVNHAPVYPREVMKRALELGAQALIVVHNHPSGDPTPSEADIAMTRDLRAAADHLGLVLHDHLIIARGSHASFRSLGLL